MTKKDYFIRLIPDLVSTAVYYDRKECEDLSREDVDELFKNDEITLDEVTELFRKEFQDYIDSVKGFKMNEKMTQEQFDKIENVWNQMEDLQRWQWLQYNQNLGFIVQMDNDSTFVTHEDIEEDYLEFDDYIGWADGIHAVMKALGVKADCV